jgi:hypothetical protein
VLGHGSSLTERLFAARVVPLWVPVGHQTARVPTSVTSTQQTAAADTLQRPLRSRFRVRLSGGVRLQFVPWRES